MKRVKKRRVKLPDPVHKQMLVVCKNKALGLKIKQLSSGIVIIKSERTSDRGMYEETVLAKP